MYVELLIYILQLLHAVPEPILRKLLHIQQRQELRCTLSINNYFNIFKQKTDWGYINSRDCGMRFLKLGFHQTAPPGPIRGCLVPFLILGTFHGVI